MYQKNEQKLIQLIRINHEILLLYKEDSVIKKMNLKTFNIVRRIVKQVPKKIVNNKYDFLNYW